MALPGVDPIAIPDDWTVWAASDVHGQVRAMDALLREAGLSDGGDTWTAPPGTALVITGDMVDRGPDSVGLVRRLAGLRAQAPARGGLVALLEGNHEVQVLGGLAGEPDIFEAMHTFGVAATFVSAGMADREWDGRTAAELRARVEALAPGFLDTLGTFAPYATWGDAVFVHGGPVPGMDLATWAAGAERLWIRHGDLLAADPFPEAPAWDAFRGAGIRRAVYGHTPVEAPAIGHGGQTLNVDTWKGGVVTLALLAPGAPFADASLLQAPVEPRAVPDAPVTPERVRAFDAALPGVVRRWWAGLATASDAASPPG